jgi:hypothetical protein
MHYKAATTGKRMRRPVVKIGWTREDGGRREVVNAVED